ncbi:MAG: HDIG domain-containing protein [Bacteroidaceae bacterium]|nr:HDIG domain-containing protein [Bacteroidaceae bacterium]
MEKRIVSSRTLVVILATVSVLLTVFTISPDNSSQYEYIEGQPWMYGELIAPFNFSIEKSEAQLANESDSLKKNFIPYFSLSGEKFEAAVEGLDKLYKDTLHGIISVQTFNNLKQGLTEIYTEGIINTVGEDILNNTDVRYIRSYSGNTSKLYNKENLYTFRTAYSHLINVGMTDRERSILATFHLEDLITPNLLYDMTRSDSELHEQENQISKYNGMVMQNQKIIDRGEIIDSEKFMIIHSYMDMQTRNTKSRQFKLMSWGGHLIYVSVLFFLLALYLFQYRRDIVDNSRSVIFLFSAITIFTVATNIFIQYSGLSKFIIPCTMLALMLRIFLDSRTAFLGYITYLLSCSLGVLIPYDFIFLQIAAGLAAIFRLHELTQRSQIFKTVFIVMVTYFVLWFATQMIQLEDIRNLSWLILVYLAINCIILLLTYPLILAVEKIFGFTSNVTLIELSNINNDILKELAETAPGTFQHSMQVSTLAAEAARAVKASSQLVRTAALYHDIGKMINPPFFTENQKNVNPHDSLTCQESARIITGHVTEGMKIAEKHHLPDSIKHFIRTHHGTGMAKYFYIKYVNEHPDEKIDETPFRYTGSNPDSKETAILMMADAVEASSRSLPEYTEELISNLVDKIVDNQVKDGYFNNCPITMQEIRKIKDVFKEELKTMYHTRISYPTPNR